MNCFFCKATMENEARTFMLEVGTSILIIKNVPSMVCTQCGEVSYSLDISRKLETILDKLEPIVEGVAIFEYSKVLDMVVA